MDFKKILWISHSAISSFERCPHLYYYEYEYRNPKTGNRIQTVNPYFSLGLAVHETIEELLELPVKERTKLSLQERFSEIFNGYRGLVGGFISSKKENDFYQRGLKMVERVEKSNFLQKPSTALETNFPTVDLIGNNVKLVGSVDWVEILPDGGAHIIDFKTGNSKEKNGSLQLPIYAVLAKNNLSREVKKVSYWYLEHDDFPAEQEIGKIDQYMEVLKEKAEEIKEAVEKNNFPCTYPGRCFSCKDYEKIFRGEAEMVLSGNGRKKDAFCVFKEEDVIEKIIYDDFLDEREKKIFEMRLKNSMDEIKKELRLKDDKAEKIVTEMKRKLKENLHTKELKITIKLLSK